MVSVAVCGRLVVLVVLRVRWTSSPHSTGGQRVPIYGQEMVGFQVAKSPTGLLAHVHTCKS